MKKQSEVESSELEVLSFTLCSCIGDYNWNQGSYDSWENVSPDSASHGENASTEVGESS